MDQKKKKNMFSLYLFIDNLYIFNKGHDSSSTFLNSFMNDSVNSLLLYQPQILYNICVSAYPFFKAVSLIIYETSYEQGISDEQKS